MRQMKKKLIIAVIVTLILTGLTAFLISCSIVNKKNEEIEELQTLVVDTQCVAFANELKADSVITQSDLKAIDIKMTSLSAGTYVANGNSIKHMILNENGNLTESKVKADTGLTMQSLVGRVVKANVSPNTLVMDSLLYKKGEEPTKDERIQEFNFLQLPSDLYENDYIDIRIKFPAGEDYTVLIGKKVERCVGENTIFVKLNEEEIMTMSSAIIEAYMQTGVKLYAIKYTDPATQLFNEEIVDYVAKYDYAVEKLSAEIRELGLRKALAKKFVDDGLYVASATGEYAMGNETIVGTVTLKIQPEDNKDISGNGITFGDEVVINIAKNIKEDGEEELIVAKESFEKVPQLTKDEVLSGNPELSNIPLDELENTILAKYSGIKEEYIEEIKLANMQNNSDILSYYKTMRVESRDEIFRTYPLKDEVLAVVRENPNLVETIKAEFDTTALLNTRLDEYEQLKAQYDAAFDEYTKQEIKQKMDAIVDERTNNVAGKLQTEIQTQRAERISYLESLING